jgi:hypothetical protein
LLREDQLAKEALQNPPKLSKKLTKRKKLSNPEKGKKVFHKIMKLMIMRSKKTMVTLKMKPTKSPKVRMDL